MTREELIKQGASKVRKTPALYALYKQYVTEDAKEMYASGRLPSGCFGCQFNSIFSRWKKHVSLGEDNHSNKKDMAVFSSKKVEKVQKKKAAPSSDRSYQLKNSAKKIYFKGAVLSKNSSDADWIAFIKYPKEAKKVKARKEFFVKLPKGLEPKKSEPKTEEATPATAQGSQAAEVSKEDTAQ